MDDIDNLVPIGMNDCSSGADSKDDHCSFKHFDVAESPLDHYFLGSNAQGNGGRKWAKKVQQEWSILDKNLPECFEDRMDLFRAVILGLEHVEHLTKMAFTSLTSTFRQNTLQGLVLNSKPYFNEAEYEKQVGTIEGEKDVIPYNENTYLLNLKSMMYLLRRPPMHFESFVKDPFRSRGHYILKACEAYMSGCLIGSLTKDAGMTEKSKGHTTSVGLKLMLAKILPRLIAVLTEVGVDCKEFENIHNS